MWARTSSNSRLAVNLGSNFPSSILISSESNLLLLIKRRGLEEDVGKKEADETQDGHNLDRHTLDTLLGLLSKSSARALLRLRTALDITLSEAAILVVG